MTELLNIKFYKFGDSGAIVIVSDKREHLITKEMMDDTNVLAYFVREALKEAL